MGQNCFKHADIMQVLIKDDTRVCELPTSDDRRGSNLAYWTLDKLLALYIHFTICQMGIILLPMT